MFCLAPSRHSPLYLLNFLTRTFISNVFLFQSTRVFSQAVRINKLAMSSLNTSSQNSLQTTLENKLREGLTPALLEVEDIRWELHFCSFILFSLERELHLYNEQTLHHISVVLEINSSSNCFTLPSMNIWSSLFFSGGCGSAFAVRIVSQHFEGRLIIAT